jgi:hypothetical protein
MYMKLSEKNIVDIDATDQTWMTLNRAMVHELFIDFKIASDSFRW